jgi:hypothetical protein
MDAPHRAPAAEPLRDRSSDGSRGTIVVCCASLAIALVATLSTLAIAAPIDASTLTARYGKPFWFAESDLSEWRLDSDRAKRIAVTFNPRENPTRIDGGRLLLAYVVFAAPLCTLAWAATNRRRFQRRRAGGATSRQVVYEAERVILA